MARGPGIISRMNYVVDTFNNPDDLPWAVYAETALPAFLEVWVAIVCFDILDIIRFIFKPAGLRSGRHMRRGRKGRNKRGKKGLGRRLVGKLPVFSHLQARHVTNGVKNLWIIDGIGQRLLWWWLMADVTSAFVYNWTTMARKTERGQLLLSPGNGLSEGPPSGVAAIQGWQGVLYGATPYSTKGVTMSNGSGVVAAGLYNIVASYTMENVFPTQTTCHLRIIGGDTVPLEVLGSDSAVLPGLQQASMVASGRLRGPGQWQIQAKIDFGGGLGIAGDVFVSGITDAVPPPISFSCTFLGFPGED